MKNLRLWLAFGGIVSLLAVAGFRYGVLGQAPRSNPVAVAPDISIHELSLTNLKGESESLSQWKGKVLVVNYWATWCHPCREEMPGFSRLHDKYRGKGVQFVGISIDTADKIIEFQKETPVSYPLLIGDMSAMETSAKLGNTMMALPFTAVFDQQGKLFSTKLGRVAESQLESQLIELTFMQ